MAHPPTPTRRLAAATLLTLLAATVAEANAATLPAPPDAATLAAAAGDAASPRATRAAAAEAAAAATPLCGAVARVTPAWTTVTGGRAASVDVELVNNHPATAVPAPWTVALAGPYAKVLQAWNVDVPSAAAVNGTVTGSAAGYWQVSEERESV